LASRPSMNPAAALTRAEGAPAQHLSVPVRVTTILKVLGKYS
jgi:hypothetical protein